MSVQTTHDFVTAPISLWAVSISSSDKLHFFYSKHNQTQGIYFLAVLLGNGLENTYDTWSSYTVQRFYDKIFEDRLYSHSSPSNVVEQSPVQGGRANSAVQELLCNLILTPAVIQIDIIWKRGGQ